MYRFSLTEAAPPEVLAAIVAIPGVNVARYGRLRGSIEAPWHAGWLVESELRKGNVAARVAVEGESKGPPSIEPVEWSTLVALWTERNEVREWVYAFCTPYQRSGVGFAAARPGAHLWHPAGAGKTLELILWALLASGPVVIVTKASARLQWAKQVERFTTLLPFVLRPEGEVRKKHRWASLAAYLRWCEGAKQRPVVVAGWQGVVGHLDALLALRPVSVGFDEAHLAKGTKRREAVVQSDGTTTYHDLKNVVTSAAKLARVARRRLCTTATPVKDRQRDLWGQLDLAEPGAWGFSSLVWMKRYAAATPGPFGGWITTGESNQAELLQRLAFVAHRVSYAETHRHLPAKRRESRYLAPEECNAESRGFNAELKRAAKLGPSHIMEVQLARTASMKRRAVVEMIADAVAEGQKVVVFTGRVADCEALGKDVRVALAKAKTSCPVWVSSGASHTQEAREATRCAYMATEGAAVLVGTAQAWGTSYDLQDTDLAIFAMLPWNGGDLHQQEGRFCRLGQARPVIIRYVICEGTIDELVAGRIISKLPAMEAVAGDTETAGARDALAGMEDRDKVADSILARLSAWGDNAEFLED